MAKGKALFQKLKNIHLNKIQKLILLFILVGKSEPDHRMVRSVFSWTCMFLRNGCLYYYIIDDECKHEFFPCDVDQCDCNNIVQYASLLADTETQR